MSDTSVVIVSAKRTPVGAFQGVLSPLTTTQLGAQAIQSAVHTAGLKNDEISNVIMGCVLPAGVGQSPARQALLGAGLSHHTSALTVNKVCGSGLESVMLANLILKTKSKIIVAGGMESMTNAPYFLPKARSGYRMGHGEIIDHMMYDGLQDAYSHKTMGVYADATAAKYGFSRQDQDDFAILSAQKALEAVAQKAFEAEIAPVTIKTRTDDVTISQDEPPTKVKIEKIPQLKPAFGADGTVTAASSSSISDGAAAVVLMTEKEALSRGLKPLARIISHAGYSHEPEWFTTAPVNAIRKTLEEAKWDVKEVDLFEINEAFAVVAMAAIKDLSLDPTKVNCRGGACALGHPIGASGTRILVTLLHALKDKGLKRGVAALCIGGGEGVAMAVEMM